MYLVRKECEAFKAQITEIELDCVFSFSLMLEYIVV